MRIDPPGPSFYILRVVRLSKLAPLNSPRFSISEVLP